MKKLSSLILALGVSLSGLVQAQGFFPDTSHCDQFVPYGYPATTDKRDVTPLCRFAYFTLHDNERKVPVYSAEWLLPENVDGEAPRKNNFRPDPMLEKDKRADNEDYHKKGWDRGHMAPAEDFRRNSVLMSQSFYLSNMIPQDPGLNRGVWRMLEFHVVSRVRKGEELFVITGPVFDGPRRTIGPGRVHVPSHVFKVIVNKQKGTVDAYMIPNTDIEGSWKNFRVSVDDIEKKAKINLLPAITQELISIRFSK